MILNFKLFIAGIVLIIHLVYYFFCTNRNIIDEDIERWKEELGLSYSSKVVQLIFLLRFKPQFRNLFYFRCRNMLNIFKIVCPEDKTIIIADDDNKIAGGALYFEHSFSTIIASRSIGKGCILRQLTTIGVKSKNRHHEKPTIGNYVDFGANVTCIGDIKIGDYAIIAAGAVVVKDVPSQAIVAGNPAKVIGFRS